MTSYSVLQNGIGKDYTVGSVTVADSSVSEFPSMLSRMTEALFFAYASRHIPLHPRGSLTGLCSFLPDTANRTCTSADDWNASRVPLFPPIVPGQGAFL